MHENLYKPDTSGLWAHSHREEDDLMKQYVVEQKTPSGWLSVASFETFEETFAERTRIAIETGATTRVFDQFLTHG